MSTLLIAQNETRESGSFCGDQLCSLRAAYLFVEHAPKDVDRIIMSVSPGNEMWFLWQRFIHKFGVELVWDNWNPGDWSARHTAWDKWRRERSIEGKPFLHYRELYLRIHGAQRQQLLCGYERGLGKRNIYQYWWCGQEPCEKELPPSVDWFDDTLVNHPPHTPTRDVYISPHAKTQGNVTFTFEFWADVVHRLVDAGISVTVGYDNNRFCGDLDGHPLYRRHWGSHEEWMEQVCQHKVVACGNTGTGWLAAACGVPMITMEPHNSIMADHRYRECGLRNILEVVDGYKLDELDNDMRRVAEYVAQRLCDVVGGDMKVRTSPYHVISQAHAYSVNPQAKLKLLADQLLLVKDVPGDMADLGTCRGGTALVMRKTAPERVLHMFDTWDGNPHDDPLCHHKKGEWKADLGDCMDLIGEDGINRYWRGVFPQSWASGWNNLEEKQFCLVYIDMDTEQATRDAIEFFWPRLEVGGRLVIDDWKWLPCAGVEKAVREFFDTERIEQYPAEHTAVVVK